MESKGEMVHSLLGYEVAHGSAIKEDGDRSMVQSSFDAKLFLAELVHHAANLKGGSCGGQWCFFQGWGFLDGVSGNGAWWGWSQGCLGTYRVGCFLWGVRGFQVPDRWQGALRVQGVIMSLVVCGGVQGMRGPGGGRSVSFPKDGVNVLGSDGCGHPVGWVAELDEGSNLSLEAMNKEEKPVSFAEIRDIQEESHELVGALGDGGGLGEQHEFLVSNMSGIDGVELPEAGIMEG
jgi:hypothetical protein